MFIIIYNPINDIFFTNRKKPIQYRTFGIGPVTGPLEFPLILDTNNFFCESRQ